jgi:hypothetical protein
MFMQNTAAIVIWKLTTDMVIDVIESCTQQIRIYFCEKYWSFFMRWQIKNRSYKHPSISTGEGLRNVVTKNALLNTWI